MIDPISGWQFTVSEVSPGHYQVIGRDSEGRSVSADSGEDALDLAIDHARAVCPLKELDTVQIAELPEPPPRVSGTEGRTQLPRVGEVGTVVLLPERGSDPVLVENVDEAGNTRWLADFPRRTLRLLARPR